MFLRRHRKRAAGETYKYWTLCESRRTAAGPRWEPQGPELAEEVVDVRGVRVERARDSLCGVAQLARRSWASRCGGGWGCTRCWRN